MRRTSLAAIALLVLAQSLPAQLGYWPGDSLLAIGRLASAESAYYSAVRVRPRDPAARTALGKYLAARGATRVGAVLLEEARFFGGDSISLARALVPLYGRLGDFAALDTLKPNVLTPAEHRRAAWLRNKPAQAAFRDSVVLRYQPLGDGRGLGTVIVALHRTEHAAIIDPRVSGLQVPASMRGELRTFTNDTSTTLGVADAIRIGGIVFSNVPATIAVDSSDVVRVGLDVVAPYAPRFDPVHRLLVLRRVERRSPPPEGTRVPALFDDNGLRLLFGDRWYASAAAMPAMLLSTRSWTFDARRGDLVLAP
ncbi:MAG TPA: hypothetical protein VFT29_03845 [Gemmatimonadaceae bacterium]|nr:hypothetical protein [Gemmatimonadaceae bacterium]